MSTSTSLIFREATSADIPALAHLHVDAWRATYERIYPLTEHETPTYEIREHQWINAFKTLDNSWFCYVVQDQDTLVGFAKGIPSAHPDFPGELSKIYLLRDYHRQGLGRKLMGYTARWFLGKDISSMLLHADAKNPSCRFFEAMGGEKLLTARGEFHGSYGWRDLRRLAELCEGKG